MWKYKQAHCRRSISGFIMDVPRQYLKEKT